MKLISQIICLYAMCCQLLVATGFVYHTHECPDPKTCHDLSSFSEITVSTATAHSCCDHNHHSSNKLQKDVSSSKTSSVNEQPHHHPCNCQLHDIPHRITTEVGNGSLRKNLPTSSYLPAYLCNHHAQFKIPPPPLQKFLYAPPPRSIGAVTLIHVHCVYLIWLNSWVSW